MSRPAGPERGPVVVLCGPMGSGKSAVGGELARRWGVSLRDTDQDIVEATGRTIPELFAADGEPAFRDLEQRTVVQALSTHDGVLSLGGGAVASEVTRAALADYVARGGRVVFLDVDAEIAMDRVGGDTNRPLLGDDPRRRWEALATQRRPLYLEVCTHHVRTGRRSLARAASVVEQRLTGS
ncbi:shikimate kinase [Isoptericola sp. b441]|uniref:Shikimate kinase n=1 Tax=Actinotalea lenta TaxID=3064654 RepID=A0ABT9D7I4_9CELL|nr:MULTISPECIES: shikimate kinase [unclassified Isoptericola]MDO8106822.1 shikimate kinase [Isoptericola sp. b441]MDO8121467.1 shikimate kinase [Isoptericola sp. b490]